jgi:hypothetical protein
MSKGLTNAEIAVVMEIEPEEAMRLRRQMYLWLGVSNVQDALAKMGMTLSLDESAKPDNVPRKPRRDKERHAEEVAAVLRNMFGGQHTREGMVIPMAVADSFPVHLWVLHYPETNHYFFLTLFGRVVGLVSLSTVLLADQFLEALEEDDPDYAEGCIPRRASFDEAREIAIERGTDALFLIDIPEDPKVHYVR